MYLFYFYYFFLVEWKRICWVSVGWVVTQGLTCSSSIMGGPVYLSGAIHTWRPRYGNPSWSTPSTLPDSHRTQFSRHFFFSLSFLRPIPRWVCLCLSLMKREMFPCNDWPLLPISFSFRRCFSTIIGDSIDDYWMGACLISNVIG